ncbi:Hypothetical predicted protein [Xyrichtys novacula]|uniref:Uncharacterized protein n=1 Tax=Xyrichtys novacula TaxID=13765 RepID=A0AAV1HHG1_XYRNO|nr:Hypothetical predicted protein [Xyrichtys novacula]
MGRFLHLTSVFIVETPRHSPLGCRPVCGLARGREHIGCLSKNRRRERQRDRDRNTNRQRRKQEYLQRNQRRNSRSWSPDEDDDTTAHPPRLELVIQKPCRGRGCLGYQTHLTCQFGQRMNPGTNQSQALQRLIRPSG